MAPAPPVPDLAIPILPCRDLETTVAFYTPWGFSAKRFTPHFPYAILRRGLVELHFFVQPDLDPRTTSSSCYIRVNDVAEWHRTMEQAGLPDAGIPRLTPVQDTPWGMREFALLDPDGNAVRIGQCL